MRRWTAVSAIVVAWVAGTVNAAGPELRVAEGYVVEMVALPPLVERPMMGCFDERGRLFVTDSAGVNRDFAKLSADPPHSIRVLEDTDGDGRFDRSSVFADKLTFPAGVLCHEGAVYVTSAPSLWKLEDLDGDGVCDRRTEIVTGFGSTGNGADLHGPFLGPDGWLYFTDGRNGHRVTLGDGTRWEGKAAAVYRCRTDGSGLEVMFGGGMDNPVEVVFTPEGEPLVSCNLVAARPRRVDGILYGIDGGVYPHDAALGEFAQTGPLLAPVADLGWVAVSGMVRAADGSFFTAQFNTHRVQRHVVERKGAGFGITATDFLTSPATDFHPTDVLEDADGSLLVIDTGGWFRIGCPASETEKPAVLGGIYRIRRADAPRVADPRGLGVNWKDVSTSELIGRLSDVRPAVAERAGRLLGGRRDAVAPLAGLAAKSPVAVWVLHLQGTVESRSVVRGVVNAAGNASARLAAIRAIGLARDREGVAVLRRCLGSADAAESREAALALARVGDASVVPALLEALKRTGDDAFHNHAVVHALNRLADPSSVAAALASDHPNVRRGAAVVLEERKRVAAPTLVDDSTVARADSEGPARRARLAELEPTLGGGDPVRGKAVFFGRTASCSSCHAVGGAGEHVGPDLTTIGSIRSRRDLLESILFPSATIARGFESYVVVTAGGEVHGGMLGDGSADAVQLLTPARVSIPRSEVKRIRPEPLSLMPRGLDAGISREDLADLLAFLGACK